MIDRPIRRPRSLLAAAASLLLLGAMAAPSSLAYGGSGPDPINGFLPVATFQVTGEVAEIAAVTPDGLTVIYTDSEEEEIGFVDITDPALPVADGLLPIGAEPTSVAITPDGLWALIAVNTSASFAVPSGHLAVVDLASRLIVATRQLGGQPDSVSVSGDGRYAAIAIENERDEDVDPDGAGGEPEGGLPQLPAGHLVIVDLIGSPAGWGLRQVDLTGLAGARFAADPEPEFVDIDPANRAAVTLQENNAVALVDLASGDVLDSWSAGIATHPADLADDGTISFTDTLTARREPDAIAWTPRGELVTANEGDYPADVAAGSGSRGFSIFNANGTLLFDSGASLELAAAAAGLYPDGRSDNRGTEPEGVEIGVYGSRTYLFVGAERGNFVAVYRLAGSSSPRLIQLLETGDRPEGLVAIPGRGLFLSANEDDGTISIFQGTQVAPAAPAG